MASAFRIAVLLGILFLFSSALAWPWTIRILLMVLFIVAVTFHRTIDRLRVWSRAKLAGSQQQYYDRRALRCMEAIGRGEDLRKFRPVVLFLRPFAADRNLRFPNDRRLDGFDIMPIESELGGLYNQWCTTIMISNHAVDRHDYWESAFLQDFTDEERLYYVGPGEFGLPAANWFSSVQQLADAANLIFVVPMDFGLSENQTGTFDELQLLFSEQLIHKCVFIMPSEQRLTRVRRVDANGVVQSVPITQSLKQLWNDGCARLNQSGFPLPPFAATPPGHSAFFGWPLGLGGPMQMYVLDRRGWPTYYYQWMKEYGKHL